MKYYVFNHHDFWQWPQDLDDVMYADIAFMWADWPFRNPVLTLSALKKKVVVYEHGFGSLWDYELNKREPIAHGYLALGKESEDSLIRAGVAPERILVTGNPIYDGIEPIKKSGRKKKALFVALHWVSDRMEYNIRMFNKLREAYDFDWTVKLNDKTADFGDCKKWLSKTDEGILQNIRDNIKNYDVIFTPRASTFESFARLYGIPVYIIDEQESYRAENDPYRVPMNYTFLNIGDELPEIKPINDDDYISRPSLGIKDILKWTEGL